MMTEINQLTLGSLFDGIGGFPFAAVLSGITPIWAAEVDPACVAVTRQRFPNMVHLGDVSKINGADIPPVDIITFGSPCQDLSVAGERKGLKHIDNGGDETTRSGLFIDAIRIVYEMRRATNGRYPAYIVWENVEGAFNSRGGRDFQTVLEKITKTDIPVPKSGKWAKAGVVRGRGICAAWRLFDAQYWGVPQRRKRIYLIGSFGSDRAAEILFKRDSVQRYLAPRGEQGQRIETVAEKSVSLPSGALGGNSADTERYLFESHGQDCRFNGPLSVAPTVSAAYGLGGGNAPMIVQSTGFHGNNSVTAAGVGMLEEQSPTLTTTKRADVVYAIGNGQTNQTDLHEIAGTLNCMHDQQAVIYTIDRAAFNQGENALYEPRISDDGINSTLVAKGPGAVAYLLYLTLKWIVRRLTPRECERLQGFPDDWTVLPKISEISDEDYDFYKAVFLLDKAVRGVTVTKEPNRKQLIRWYNGLDNDGARYRMLGNSLAIPCALRVIGYIADYERTGK